jgi:hypothetical protein
LRQQAKLYCRIKKESRKSRRIEEVPPMVTMPPDKLSIGSLHWMDGSS